MGEWEKTETLKTDDKKQNDIGPADFHAIDGVYEHILGQLVRMIDHPEKWVIGEPKNR